MLIRDPIYCQLNDLLRSLLRKGEFSADSQFLTERQISERFGVSRTTANKALSTLVAEGVLEFRKGVGTFVRGDRLDYDLRALVSFTEKARAVGKEPSTRVLCLRREQVREADPEMVAPLHLSADDAVYYLERLRYADEVPVILERRYLVARFVPNLTDEAVAGSLYALLTEQYGLEVVGADETIRAVCVHGDDVRLLQMDEGAAGLLVSAVGLLKGDIPLWYEETLYRGDAYEFRNRLGPVKKARPAAGVLRG
jgi:GntR family transcriptional regulator